MVLTFRDRKEFHTSMGKRAYSAFLAALIALPMYYMFYSIFHWGFDGGAFLVALGIGVATFVITLAIAALVRRQRQQTS